MIPLKKHLISIDKIFTRFDNHFQDINNTNIIFSGKFGTGKSYFLKSYFEEEKIKDNYQPFFISPVNYSVASNEDIFELIKVDTIYNLFLQGHLEIDKKVSLDKEKVIASYIFNKPVSIVKHFSSLLSKLSVTMEVLSGMSNSVEELLKDFSEYEKKLNESLQQPKGNKALEFIETKEDVKGSYLEYDIISRIIVDTLGATNKGGKKNVLVIDDVDRLDPGHIFRILNVLSSHNHSGNNKFGFDKVILVCDLDNIEFIFKHIYGPQTDFEGYIDKFYSIERFNFNNSEAIHHYLKSEFKNFLKEDEIKILAYILILFESCGSINLRKIMKMRSIETVPDNNYTSYGVSVDEIKEHNGLVRGGIYYINEGIDTIYYLAEDIRLRIIFRILRTLFKNYETLSYALNDLKVLNYPIRDKDLIQSAINVLALPKSIITKTNRFTIFFRDPPYSYDHPEIIIGNMQCTIRPIWNAQNKYDGRKSFFYNMTDVDYHIIESKINYQLLDRELLLEVQACYKYLKSNNMLID